MNAYRRICDRGVELAKDRLLSGEYHEKHHIIPRSWGGSNRRENIAVLTGREHFIAHKLLARANPDNRQMQLAALQMAIDPRGRGYVVRSFDYERMRKAFARSQTGSANHACRPEVRAKISKTKTGMPSTKKGLPMSIESRRKMSEAKKLLVGDRHPRHGAKLSDETKAKISAANKGKLLGPAHPMYGKSRPDHVREAISNSLKGRARTSPSAATGARPWRTPHVRLSADMILLWKQADAIHAAWKEQDRKSAEALRRRFAPDAGRGAFDTMLKHFGGGWIPQQDAEWLSFVSEAI